MKIVMTLLVRDEEDIVSENLQYHLEQGVDHVIVTDNRSRDSTRDLLEPFRRSGLVTVIDEQDDTYAQGHWVTRMARLAAADGADWVVHTDADEFWWPKEGDLRTCLAAIPAECGVVEAPRLNFLPCRRESGRFHERLLIRQIRSTNHEGQPLPPKVCHRADPSVVVVQGNHRVSNVQYGVLRPPGPLVILHFPMRTWRQFQLKIVTGGAAYQRNTELPRKVGKTWRDLYDLHLAGSLREHYESALVESHDLNAEIAGGRLIVDRRLAIWMQDHQLCTEGIDAVDLDTVDLDTVDTADGSVSARVYNA
jgi:Glycosyl transferase family 2